MSQNNQKDFFGIIVPAKILNSNELSISEKFVYSYVASYGEFCGDGNDKIARRLGVSVKTVTRALARLQQLGYIEVKYTNNVSASRKIFDAYKAISKKSVFKAKNDLNNIGFRRGLPQLLRNIVENSVEN